MHYWLNSVTSYGGLVGLAAVGLWLATGNASEATRFSVLAWSGFSIVLGLFLALDWLKIHWKDAAIWLAGWLVLPALVAGFVVYQVVKLAGKIGGV